MVGGDFNSNSNPLAHLNESVNSLDPLNAMEKSLNDQVSYLHKVLWSNVCCALKNILKILKFLFQK
jgi:hypothetical protein